MVLVHEKLDDTGKLNRVL